MVTVVFHLKLAGGLKSRRFLVFVWVSLALLKMMLYFEVRKPVMIIRSASYLLANVTVSRFTCTNKLKIRQIFKVINALPGPFPTEYSTLVTNKVQLVGFVVIQQIDVRGPLEITNMTCIFRRHENWHSVKSFSRSSLENRCTF